MRNLFVAVVIGAVGIPLGVAIAQQSSTPPRADKEGAAKPRQAEAGGPRMPDTYGLMILIRSTLLAVNHANLTGNYTVLRDLGTPGFQQSNNPARLADVFRGLRERNLDLSPVALLDAKLRRQPSLAPNGRLRLTGFFPSKPEQVNFDLTFYYRNDRWRLDGIALNTTANEAAGPAPSKTNAASSAKPATKPPPPPAKKSSVKTAPPASQKPKPAAKKTNPGVQERVDTVEAPPPPAKEKEPESKRQGWNPFSSN